MRIFKKHKSKETMHFNVGIQECRTCEKNKRCAECFYMNENRALNKEIERLKSEKEKLTKVYRESQVSNLKAFVKSLCKDRVSNDPVVIAAKVELEEWIGETE